MGCNSWNKDLTQLGKPSFSFATEKKHVNSNAMLFRAVPHCFGYVRINPFSFEYKDYVPPADNPANSSPTALTPR